MSSNKAAYELAYQRAAEGKGQALWDRVLSMFEDEYTRQSRLKGERDGAASLSATNETLEVAAS